MPRIYVGNLNFRTDDLGLRAVFEEFGSVTDVHIVTDRETGRSRGFAFVEMPDEAQAAKAIEQLSGKEIEGRPLTVNVARPREDRPRGGAGGGGYNSGGGDRPRRDNW